MSELFRSVSRFVHILSSKFPKRWYIQAKVKGHFCNGRECFFCKAVLVDQKAEMYAQLRWERSRFMGRLYLRSDLKALVERASASKPVDVVLRDIPDVNAQMTKPSPEVKIRELRPAA